MQYLKIVIPQTQDTEWQEVTLPLLSCQRHKPTSRLNGRGNERVVYAISFAVQVYMGQVVENEGMLHGVCHVCGAKTMGGSTFWTITGEFTPYCGEVQPGYRRNIRLESVEIVDQVCPNVYPLI